MKAPSPQPSPASKGVRILPQAGEGEEAGEWEDKPCESPSSDRATSVSSRARAWRMPAIAAEDRKVTELAAGNCCSGRTWMKWR